MKKPINPIILILISIVITITVGFFWHELYDWSGQKPVFAFFAPINESKWEHYKIIFFPVLISAAFEYLLTDDRFHNFLFSKAITILVFEFITFSLIELFELFIDPAPTFVHIGAYIIGGIISIIIGYLIMLNTSFSSTYYRIALLILMIHSILFIMFTVNPPDAAYFKEMSSNIKA